MNLRCRLAVTTIAATVLIGVIASIGKAAPPDVPENITIATGNVGGIYHPVGGAICKLVNEGTTEHGMTCTVEITSGSSENIRDLRVRGVGLAMAQSDSQYSAVKGIGPFEEDGPFDAMRSMFAPYVEQFTLVAREDADINSFKDLRGKRVYMGSPGSGKRETMDVIMEAFGWSREDVEEVSKLKASNVSEALCDNEIDAFVYTIGHPSPEVREAIATCRAVVAPVSGRAIERLVNRSPIYVSSVIPKGLYKGQTRDIPTVGVVATLVATEKTHPEVVYQVTKAFFENLDRLREATPLFSSLNSRDMVSTGQTAPLHEGASRYFAEAGLQ